MKSESAWHRADAIAAFRNPQHAEYGWRSNRPTSSSSSSWAKGGPICGTLSCHTGHGITRAPDDNPLSVHTDDATLDSHSIRSQRSVVRPVISWFARDLRVSIPTPSWRGGGGVHASRSDEFTTNFLGWIEWLALVGQGIEARVKF